MLNNIRILKLSSFFLSKKVLLWIFFFEVANQMGSLDDSKGMVKVPMKKLDNAMYFS